MRFDNSYPLFRIILLILILVGADSSLAQSVSSPTAPLNSREKQYFLALFERVVTVPSMLTATDAEHKAFVRLFSLNSSEDAFLRAATAEARRRFEDLNQQERQVTSKGRLTDADRSNISKLVILRDQEVERLTMSLLSSFRPETASRIRGSIRLFEELVTKKGYK